MPKRTWSKTEWTAEFETRLMLDLRPDIGAKFAQTIALSEWTYRGDLEPDEAAKRWAAQSANPTKPK